MTADAAAIRATVEAYTAAFSAGDRAAYLGLFAEDARVEDPVGTPEHVGTEAIAAFFDANRGLADDIELRRTGPVRVAAGQCAFPMQARPLLGDTRYCMDIIDVMTFDAAGRITSMRAFWDPTEMYVAED